MKQFLRRLVEIFVLPPAGPLWLALAGSLTLLTRWRKVGRWMIGIALVSLYLLSTQVVQTAIVATVDHHPPLPHNGEGWEPADAIVVLGAGVQWGSREWDGDAPSSMAVARLRYAAEVHRRTELPVLVTGYTGDGMKVVMERDFGIPVEWIEDRSYDTIQNAEKNRPHPASRKDQTGLPGDPFLAYAPFCARLSSGGYRSGARAHGFRRPPTGRKPARPMASPGRSAFRGQPGVPRMDRPGLVLVALHLIVGAADLGPPLDDDSPRLQSVFIQA